MGHKTHPTGFRLGITKKHNSSWFSDFKEYSSLLKEDNQIRFQLLKFLNSKNIKGISKIVIVRNNKGDQIILQIWTAFPGVFVGKEGKNLEEINGFLTKKFLTLKKKILINLIEIKEQFKDANLIGDYIVEQLEKRVQFKRAVKQAITSARLQKEVQGIKIQVSGRLNGAEIARSEWLRDGRVPLQTLKAEIDYSNKSAQTVYGILGIKIWLFKA